MFYDNVTNNISNYHKVVDELLVKLDLNNNILRAKANYLSQNNSFTKDNFHTHIDFKVKHKVVLYYVNNSDGDTLFFDKEGRL